jgi:hypothetical protein
MTTFGTDGAATGPGGDFDFGSAMDNVAGEVFAERDREEGKPPAAPAPRGEALGETREVSAPVPPPPASAPPPPAEVPYPKSWKPDFQTHWATLPPEIRAEVIRREDDFHRGTAPLRTAAQFVQRFQQASAPVQEYLASGVDPIELYSNFAQAHAKLSRGGPEAVDFLRSLAADYKLDLAAEPAYVDPQLKALQDELSGVKSVLSTQQQAAANARKAELATRVSTFAADPKNEHFDLVAGDMANLLRADPQLTLEDAYAKALWISPVAREKLLAKEVETRRLAEVEAERKRAEEAAAASKGSVRNSARTAPATGAVGSMDDTMRSTLKELRSKS